MSCFTANCFSFFILNDYLIELAEIVDKAVDDFLLKKDYTEFIYLLRRYTETNESRADFIHVVSYPEGFFRLFDKRGKAIKSGLLLEGAGCEQGQDEVSYEDLLISLLVSLVPRQKEQLKIWTTLPGADAPQTVPSFIPGFTC